MMVAADEYPEVAFGNSSHHEAIVNEARTIIARLLGLGLINISATAKTGLELSRPADKINCLLLLRAAVGDVTV